MNLVDILIWVVLLGFAVKGFMKGLVREVCSLLGLSVGGWAAFLFFRPFAEVLRTNIHLPHNMASVLSFALIFLTSGLIFFLLGHLLTTLLKIVLLGGVNRIGGILVGAAQAALVLSVILSLGVAKPVPAGVRSPIEKSASAGPFVVCGNKIRSWWKNGGETGPGAAPASRLHGSAPPGRDGSPREKSDVR